MTLNYSHLYYFWITAQERGFSRAAQRLGLSQSAVSLQIQSLERNLGHQLIDRTPKKFVLTERGKVTLSYCDEIFSQERWLISDLKNGSRSEFLRIGLDTKLSTDLAIEILQPQKWISKGSFKIESLGLDEIVSRLLDQKLDVALCNSRPSQNSDRHLKIRALQGTTLSIFASSTKRLPLNKNLDHLEGVLVFVAAAHISFVTAIENVLPKVNIQVVPDLVWVQALALNGGGLGLLPSSRTPEFRKKFQIIKDLKTAQPCFLVHRNGSEKSKTLGPFLKNI